MWLIAISNFQDKFYQIFEEDVVKGNVAVIRKSGDGEFEDMEMNMHFVNKKIKYTWDANLQVITNTIHEKFSAVFIFQNWNMYALTIFQIYC